MFNKILKDMLKNLTRFSLVFLIGFLVSSCNTDTVDNNITVWQLNDPIKLNPMTATDGGSRRIMERIFQPLLQIDYFTYEIVPVLATSRPVITENPDSTVSMEFEIREEAVWDDTGEPITGHDVDFTLRLMKTPGASAHSIQLYFNYIKDIKIDEKNNKKFTLICDRYMIMESALTDLSICPAHIYDPENVLKNFTVKQLTEDAKALKENTELKRYATFFNEVDFTNSIVVGSGPYTFDSWKPNEKVTLHKKKSWWGNNVKDNNNWLKALPETLVFKTVPDINTAVSALETFELDAMYRIDPRKFMEELRKDSSFINNFHHGTPSQFVYSYLGMNMKSPKLDDVNTRKALRHLMDTEGYSETVFFGLGERVSTFIHPSKKQFINEDLVLPDYNVVKAKELLAKAGWKDSNQDGILDKKIDGKLVDFKIEVLYPSKANTSEEGVLIFQNTCKQAGIKIVPIGLDFRVMLEQLKGRDFEMYFGLWQAATVESDPTQIWHTNSIGNGGHNYPGFGNAKSDKILEDLVVELDESKRAVMYKELQQMIDDEAPYIFLLAVKNRVAVSKKITKPNFSSLGNGYWVQGFEIDLQ